MSYLNNYKRNKKLIKYKIKDKEMIQYLSIYSWKFSWLFPRKNGEFEHFSNGYSRIIINKIIKTEIIQLFETKLAKQNSLQCQTKCQGGVQIKPYALTLYLWRVGKQFLQVNTTRLYTVCKPIWFDEFLAVLNWAQRFDVVCTDKCFARSRR